MPDRKNAPLEAWLLQRSAMTALCMNNAQVHALLHVALQEGWSVEKFLEQAVLTLGQLSAAITTECIRLQMLVPPPPIVVDGKTYRFMNPEELDGRQPDPPGPVRS